MAITAQIGKKIKKRIAQATRISIRNDSMKSLVYPAIILSHSDANYSGLIPMAKRKHSCYYISKEAKPVKWIAVAAASLFLLFASGLPADDNAAAPQSEPAAKNAITYPEDLPRVLVMESNYAPVDPPKQQEFVEVTAPDYPGLKLELPSLKNLISVRKSMIVFPTHDPAYYQEGGMILSYWGFPMASSQVISTAVPDIP